MNPKEIIDALNSLGGKISMGGGTMLAFMYGIFKANQGIDNRIDKRAESKVNHAIAEQIPELIEKGIEKSARLATLEVGVEGIKDTVDKILDIHLNGGNK